MPSLPPSTSPLSHALTSNATSRHRGSTGTMWPSSGYSYNVAPYRCATRRTTLGGVMRSRPAATTSIGHRTASASTATPRSAMSRADRADSGTSRRYTASRSPGGSSPSARRVISRRLGISGRLRASAGRCRSVAMTSAALRRAQMPRGAAGVSATTPIGSIRAASAWGDEPAHAVANHDDVTEATRRRGRVIDVIRQHHASDVGDGSRAGTSAQVQRIGVPAARREE